MAQNSVQTEKAQEYLKELYFQEQEALLMFQGEVPPKVRSQLRRLILRLHDERAFIEKRLLEIYEERSASSGAN